MLAKSVHELRRDDAEVMTDEFVQLGQGLRDGTSRHEGSLWDVLVQDIYFIEGGKAAEVDIVMMGNAGGHDLDQACRDKPNMCNAARMSQGSHPNAPQCRGKFLDDFLLNRIGCQVLLGHFLACRAGQKILDHAIESDIEALCVC